MELIREVFSGLLILVLTIGIVAAIAWAVYKKESTSKLLLAIKRHFRPTRLDALTITERQFPPQIRADLHLAIEDFVSQSDVLHFTGVESDGVFGGVDFSSLLNESFIKLTSGVKAGPPQYEHIDIGDDEPMRVLKSGLWLIERESTSLAILFAPLSGFGDCGVSQTMRIQVASSSEPDSLEIAKQFLTHLEQAVEHARCYRGKVLSLEASSEYSGQSVGVQVHRLSNVPRENVILPESTLTLLERNVIQFIEHREKLAQCGMSTKKGLLFYGPPGTGKTHTIRHLANRLAKHTTFLISADQIALLADYMTLARMMQPSVVVIEDVDLIARERTRMKSPQAESMLNRLLNEMDGLREDSEILFILTTNRPQDLESALASRPGRIDQAIEFPRPDEKGREKLVKLYSRGTEVSEEVLQSIVKRTDGVSASFMKELMRRAAQCQFEKDAGTQIESKSVEQSLDEMLFTGGSFNSKLLGGVDPPND